MSRGKRISFGILGLILLAGGNWAVWRYEPLRARLVGQDPSSPASSSAQHVGHNPSAGPAGQGKHAGHTAPAGERKVLYWYDPMHPAYKSDNPGTAPDCGMQLVSKYADEEEGMENMPPGTAMISPAKQQLIGVRTDTVQREHLTRTIRAVARVQVDETKIAPIHVKLAAWVEQVKV
jgi:Cu(I)/Ag(I) efflux system membrane fusion protein